MDAKIAHKLTYSYSSPVVLDPHTIYLHPRKSAFLTVLDYSLAIHPKPVQVSKNLDPEGNIQNIIFFKDPTEELTITMNARVETTEFNPFDFVFFPFESKSLPMIYTKSYQKTLSPYLGLEGVSTIVEQVARQIGSEVQWKTSEFLTALNEFIYTNFAYEIREEGPPNPPESTLVNRKGTCRDYAILFSALCRSLGLATRFVSGYYTGLAPVDLPNQNHYLHAWVEVYLPGGGWRGYDPTQHEVVSGNHIPLAASCLAEEITPVFGSYRGNANSHLHTEVFIQREE
jgi:transglutaminase-like putative cysteine protease